MYHSSLIHLFTNGHLGCFQHLAIVNSAAMNIRVHRFFWIGVSGFLVYILSSGITGSIFNFLRKFHIVLHSGYISMHFHQQCTNLPFFFSHPHKHLFCDLLMIAILTGVRWYLIVALICLSLMASDAELPSYVSRPLYVFLGEVFVQVLCPFFNLIVCFPDVESYEFFIYFGD